MEETTQYTLLKMLSDGGWTMIPLGACSLIAVAIIIERFFWGASLARSIPEALQREVHQLLSQGKFDEVLGLCRASNTPLARIVLTALKNAHRPRAELTEALELTGKKEVQTMQKGLPALNTIAAISPLLGLLGTISGMIRTFSAISEHGVGNAHMLSAGISEALITTAAGLSIALFAVVFYRYFLQQTQKIILAMEEYALSLLDTIQANQTELRKTGTQNA